MRKFALLHIIMIVAVVTIISCTKQGTEIPQSKKPYVNQDKKDPLLKRFDGMTIEAIQSQLSNNTTARVSGVTIDPVVTSKSQNIAAGVTAAVDADTIGYRIKTVGDTDPISDMLFFINSPVPAIAQMRIFTGQNPPLPIEINKTGLTLISGLSLSLQKDSSNLIRVVCTYNKIGVEHVTSYTPSQVVLLGYRTKNQIGFTFCTAPKKVTTFAKPSYVISRSTRDVVGPGWSWIADVTVYADPMGGYLDQNALPINLRANDSVFLHQGPNTIQLQDEYGNIVSSSSSVSGVKGGKMKVEIAPSSRYVTANGKTFKVFINADHIGMTGTNQVEFSISPGDYNSWTDRAGGATTPQVGTQYILGYPTDAFIVYGRIGR